MYNRTLSADEAGQLYRLTAPTGVDTSLKGYWSFNGKDVSGTTAYDRSGAGNTGTLTNGPVISEGKLGQALDFFPGGTDTDAYVSIGDPTSGIFDFGSGDFTLGMWLRTTGYINNGSSVNRPIYKKGISNSSGYGLVITSSNFIQFILGNGTTDFTATSSQTVNDNQWHHVFGVRTGDNILLYLDGVQVATTAVSGSVSSPIGFYIGDDASGSRNVDGLIDEVRVYNRALSASEIMALYNLSR